jgi:hypothetical protein
MHAGGAGAPVIAPLTAPLVTIAPVGIEPVAALPPVGLAPMVDPFIPTAAAPLADAPATTTDQTAVVDPVTASTTTLTSSVADLPLPALAFPECFSCRALLCMFNTSGSTNFFFSG